MHTETVKSLNSSRGGAGPSRTANGIVLIKIYNDLPFADMEIDPLLWWNSKQLDGTLRPLIPVNQKFVCVPATSCPSEQLFSKAGELISARRSALSSDVVDMLLFLNKNA